MNCTFLSVKRVDTELLQYRGDIVQKRSISYPSNEYIHNTQHRSSTTNNYKKRNLQDNERSRASCFEK